VRVLVTGADGFVGKNLCAALECIRDGKDRRSHLQRLLPLELYRYDRRSSPDELTRWCGTCDFVFHLAGVNRPKDPAEFDGNAQGLEEVLSCLRAAGNRCPVMLASSVQATLEGRYAGSAYGESKLAAERLLRAHGEACGSRVLVYRLPNLYGKWCRPNYNSVVATFCDAIAHGRPYVVNDPSTELELLYIDDLVEELLRALLGQERREGDFCVAGPTDRVTLGKVAELLEGFRAARTSLLVPDVSAGSFSSKLLSTYQSYLDPHDLSYALDAKADARGSFVEVLKTPDRGQVSVNVSAPGATKGQHWHHSKWEKFLVVSGEALIRVRRLGRDAAGEPHPVVEYHVRGDEPTVVEMVPGHVHSIENLSDEHELVTLMWASECFDPDHPDTFFEEI
jgi:UDP-2-acetamido-2,6-beta-L-arabino-hexul-4-ose reductase